MCIIINLINQINENIKILIKGKEYTVLTKAWYSILEDSTVEYVKCELTNQQVLVISPGDDLMYLGRVIPNFEYERLNEKQLKYHDMLFNKTGEGHQYIKKIEFGKKENIEGECLFEDYEADNFIISLGVMLNDSSRADVLAEILDVNDITIS